MQKLTRAFYSSDIATFLDSSHEAILGILARNNHFELSQEQRTAWLEQILIFQKQLYGFCGHICFEYSIPRMGKRADIVLLIQGLVFVIECKIGSSSYDSSAIDQVTDYALDLKNFHAASKLQPIFPILLASKASNHSSDIIQYPDKTHAPLFANADNLKSLLKSCLSTQKNTIRDFSSEEWIESDYHPTPTIVEAAQALYAGHSVSEISRHDAGAKNLSKTSLEITKIIHKTKDTQSKSICFITGVPGAGKTLAGLNIASQWQDPDNNQHAVFLSGNGPLVKILREALSRDEIKRCKLHGKKSTKQESLRKASAIIQNIHHFRDDMLRTESPPVEHVVIFDEAQRAWDKKQASTFMQTKRGLPHFTQSEPEFLLSIMDRHINWAVIICLVGGGQEINTGEAGISEWFAALQNKFPNWQVWVSPNLNDSEYTANNAKIHLAALPNTTWLPDLHLSTSVRSFRSDKVALFVKNLLDNKASLTQENLTEITRTYPIVLTRDINTARKWIRTSARGSERYGLVASANAQRLKAIGIDVKSKIDEISWFLNNKEDVRSSFYMEGAATEFDIQGLELDWTGIVWDADLRFHNKAWQHWQFRGSRWNKVHQLANQQYLKNAYRVLLTRARQGMVIVVPHGNPDDHTRLPVFYDSTFNFLLSLGIPQI